MVILIVGLVCVFLALFLGLASMGGLTPEKGGVTQSVAVLDKLTAAPQEMREAYDPPFMDRVVAPLLGQFQTTTKLLTSAESSEKIRHKLELAGNPPGWTPERVRGLKALGLVAGGALGLGGCLLFGVSIPIGIVLVAVTAGLGFLGPNLFLYQVVYNRQEELKTALADAIDLLTISIEAGLAFDSACAQVARNTEGPLAAEFARMLQEMQIGKSRAEALRSLGERTTLPDLKSFVGAMVQADAFGIPIGQVLRVQSAEIRVKKRQWAEEAAQKVPVKILPPLVCLILPCLFIAVLGPAGINIATNLSGM